MRVLLPALYGRVPVLNLLIRCLAELDAFVAQSDHPPVVYFVDDNFIGDRQATRKPLPRLVEWQRQHSHPLQFACEATLHKAKQTDILGLMRQAGFLIVFVGIETWNSALLIQFVEDSQVPILTINVLQALPKTPLWDRLAHENRLR